MYREIRRIKKNDYVPAPAREMSRNDARSAALLIGMLRPVSICYDNEAAYETRHADFERADVIVKRRRDRRGGK